MMLLTVAGSSGLVGVKAPEPFWCVKLLKDINPYGDANLGVVSPEFKGFVYFRASAGAALGRAGSQLWRTDGTGGGTQEFKVINPSRDSQTNNFTIVGNTMYFSAQNANTGEELWKTDGTVAGTVQVKDIGPGSKSSSPRSLHNLNGVLYFFARSYENGLPTDVQLWKSDGTEAGTVRMTDATGHPVGMTGNLFFEPYTAVMNGVLYFSNNGLWRTDGSPAGTYLVKGGFSNAEYMTIAGGKLFFRPQEITGENGTLQQQLWVSDGTTAGTFRLASNYPSFLSHAGSLLYFKSGSDLWKSNGTIAGTTPVISNVPGVFDTFGALNGELYFPRDDGILGEELWKTDGTPAGTKLVKNINTALDQDPSISHRGSSPGAQTGFRRFNGKLYFGAHDAVHGWELWATDGTTSGTNMIKDIDPQNDEVSNLNDLFPLGAINGKLLIIANDGAHGAELFIYGLCGNIPTTNPTPVGKESSGPVNTLVVKPHGNPAGQVLTVEISGVSGGTVMLELTDSHGRAVHQRVVEAKDDSLWQTIPIGRQPEGTYILRVTSGNQLKTVRIVKMN